MLLTGGFACFFQDIYAFFSSYSYSLMVAGFINAHELILHHADAESSTMSIFIFKFSIYLFLRKRRNKVRIEKNRHGDVMNRKSIGGLFEYI